MYVVSLCAYPSTFVHTATLRRSEQTLFASHSAAVLGWRGLAEIINIRVLFHSALCHSNLTYIATLLAHPHPHCRKSTAFTAANVIISLWFIPVTPSHHQRYMSPWLANHPQSHDSTLTPVMLRWLVDTMPTSSTCGERRKENRAVIICQLKYLFARNKELYEHGIGREKILWLENNGLHTHID